MYVKAILKSKAENAKGAAVVMASATMSLAAVAQTLASHNIGAVVIATEDNRVAGIFSERDFVRHVAKSGATALERPISDFMTRHVITCVEDDSIGDVMEKMTRGRFRHLPVLGADGRLVGLISIGDVVKFHVEEVKHEAIALREFITQH